MWLSHLSDEQRSRPPAQALPIRVSTHWPGLLRALRMRYGHSTRHASRIRANASETRLMGISEIGSSLIVCGDPANCMTNSPGAGIEQAKDCGSSP